MAEKVTIELPDDIVRQARAVASRTQSSLDAVLLDWIRHAGARPALELLPDEELLGLCEREPDPAEQEELSELLERNQDGSLPAADRQRLDELMRNYRAGLVRKAQAIQLAVARGLRAPLS